MLGFTEGWAGCGISCRSFKRANKSSWTHLKFISDNTFALFLSESVWGGQTTSPDENVLQGRNMLVFNPKVPHAEIKEPLLMTSVWKMWRGSFFWAAIPQSLPCFHTSSLTACSEDAVQLFHARSTTTQMTYGASFVSTGPTSQAHFIKYKSQGNSYKSKSCGSNMQRCIWDLKRIYIT